MLVSVGSVNVKVLVSELVIVGNVSVSVSVAVDVGRVSVTDPVREGRVYENV